MATIPYQPGYTVQPKYGLRYGPSQFAPTLGTTGAGSAATPLPTQNIPATMGSGAGGLPQLRDPFANNAALQQAQTNFSTTANYGQPIASAGVTSNVGFRPNESVYSLPTSSAAPVIPPMTTAPPAPQTTTTAMSFDNDRNEEGIDNREIANSLGYTQGTQNPFGFISAALPFGLGSFLNADNSKYTYGNPGTYDAEGNVFGQDGRAYNPITGQPAQSYASKDAWLGGWLGIGTPEGAFGSSSSYGKLRAAGADIPNSFLGSYGNSVYRQMEIDPSLSVVGARAARMRGANAPINTVGSIVAANTALANDPSSADIMEGGAVTPAMLGFTGKRMGEPKTTTGKFGTGPGDIVALDGGLGYGIITDSGAIMSNSGTIVGLSNTLDPGAPNISTVNSQITGFSPEAQAELNRREGSEGRNAPANGYTGYSGDDVEDSYSLGTTTDTPAPGSAAAVQSVLDSLDPSKSISSDVTTSISDIVSGTGMTPVSTVPAPAPAPEPPSDNNNNDDPGHNAPSGGYTGYSGDDVEDSYSVPTDNNNDSGGGGGGGTHCCTAAEKRGDMSLTEVKKLRAWHRKQSIIWQEGYDIWGKVIADHLVAKFKWQSDRVKDFYNHKIYGKRTLGSVYADIVIYPMSIIIGCSVLLSSFIIREKNNETKKSF